MERRRRKSEPGATTAAADDRSAVRAGGTSAGAPSNLIAQRAYQRFEQRGREHGHDLEDWLEAERELTGPAR